MIHANQLIARLGQQDRHLLLAIGEDIRLSPGFVLFECGEEAASVYFPTEGAVVLTVPSAPTRGLGILLVGAEGMLGMQRVLGDSRSTMRAAAQTAGRAVRINAPEFSRMLESSHTLRGVMLDYVGGVVNQVSAAAACTRCHSVWQRLAGWLLMTRDREEVDTFHLTQDALALTLGVRRVGITVAAQALQRLHLIDYRRGDITVVDVAGLKAVAGHSYFACVGASANARASARRVRGARRSAAITAAANVASQS